MLASRPRWSRRLTSTTHNTESVALLVARRTNNQPTIGRLRVRGLLKYCVSQCWQVTAGARCGRPPLLLPSCRKSEFRLSALMDSDLAWVNGKSGRQSWRYACWRFPALYNIGSHLPFNNINNTLNFIHQKVGQHTIYTIWKNSLLSVFMTTGVRPVGHEKANDSNTNMEGCQLSNILSQQTRQNSFPFDVILIFQDDSLGLDHRWSNRFIQRAGSVERRHHLSIHCLFYAALARRLR